MHLPGGGNRAPNLVLAFRPLVAGLSGSAVSLRLSGWTDSPARNLPTVSFTAALLPKHKFPVASTLAHPQMASSALKSGLYPGRACPRENGGSPAALPLRASADIPAPPRHDGPGHCPRSRSTGQGASVATAPGRPPGSRRCCCHPVPSTPPPPSPGTTPNSSWPSRHTVDWWSPPTQAYPSATVNGAEKLGHWGGGIVYQWHED